MKITAGLGSIDDYEAFAKAGADECFIGYVPSKWMRKDGLSMPLNRREVCYVNVQIGSESELLILRDMMADFKVPVTIALNGLYYRPEQYEEILEMIRHLMDIGFSSFIIADPALLVLLKSRIHDDRLKLHLSGEMSEQNHLMMEQLMNSQVSRLIFHRKVTLKDMSLMTKGNPSLEYEAFAMNEMCHFHGGFCNSLHCDELCHMCLVPYKTGKLAGDYLELPEKEEITDDYLPGRSGCGLCSLYDLREAGVSYLKLVGRGNYSEDMISDIKALKKALHILEKADTKADYIQKMKKEIFPHGCSGNCYYYGGY